MTTRESRKIRSSLKKKGFKESSTDHFWYVLHFHGKKTSIRTKISFGKMEYDDGFHYLYLVLNRSAILFDGPLVFVPSGHIIIDPGRLHGRTSFDEPLPVNLIKE